jgi:hypothetical protein
LIHEKLGAKLEPGRRPSIQDIKAAGIYNKRPSSSLDIVEESAGSFLQWYSHTKEETKRKTMSWHGVPNHAKPKAPEEAAEAPATGEGLKSTKIQQVWRGALTRKKYSGKIKMNRHRNRVIKELLTTERVYNERLNTMREVAVQPLQWNAKHSQKPILSETEISSLFSNVLGILDLSSQLLEKLEHTAKLNTKSRPRGSVAGIRKPGVEDIGVHFKAIVPFFKIYIDYCKNFDNSLQLLNEVEKRPLFQTFWSLCQKHPDMLNVGQLNSFLILPVQRIPRCVGLLYLGLGRGGKGNIGGE